MATLDHVEAQAMPEVGQKRTLGDAFPPQQGAFPQQDVNGTEAQQFDAKKLRSM